MDPKDTEELVPPLFVGVGENAHHHPSPPTVAMSTGPRVIRAGELALPPISLTVALGRLGHAPDVGNMALKAWVSQP